MAAPMTIEKKLRDIQTKIDGGDIGLGDRLKDLAVKAIYAGFGSTAWRDFMNEFASTSDQLLRLTTEATDCHDYQRPARAYLAGNCVCLPDTTTTLLQGIEHYLDVSLNLPPAPAGVNPSNP